MSFFLRPVNRATALFHIVANAVLCQESVAAGIQEFSTQGGGVIK